jgi:hypothetical protein
MFSNPVNVGRKGQLLCQLDSIIQITSRTKTGKGTPLGVFLIHDLMFAYPNYCLNKSKAVARLFLAKRSDRTSMKPLSLKKDSVNKRSSIKV